MTDKAKKPYRLIKYASYDAAANMAIDEAILTAHLNADVPPTLRLYQFAPPAVSFGYAQAIDPSLINKIKQRGFDVVRRPTGGRAVLHLGDLTYAFICSSKGAPVQNYALVSESIATAYKKICQALTVALQSLGVEASIGAKKSNYKDKQDCFLASTAADLQHHGNKLIGSAQLRRRHAVLQHGSLILDQPQFLMQELFDTKQSSDDKAHGQLHHVNFYEITSQKYTIDRIIDAIKYGFEQVFENQFSEAELTAVEQDLVNQLIKKYKSLL